jgi:hypothetical protein
LSSAQLLSERGFFDRTSEEPLLIDDEPDDLDKASEIEDEFGND